MKYGENNIINFKKFNDFYAIFAKNSTGKSTLYDCILYSIYGQSSRGGSYDLINKDSKFMETEIVLCVNDIEYKIIRKISKLNEKSHLIKTDILNIFENNINIAYDVRKSSKIIEEKICLYNEFVRNSIIAQHIDVNFMNLNSRDKINYLSNISRLEVIKQISSDCNAIFKNKKKEYTQKCCDTLKFNDYNDNSTIYNKKNNIIVDLRQNIKNKLKLYLNNKDKILQKINNNKSNLDVLHP